MATTITSECINCGACEPECPNTAIYAGGVPWELNGAPGAAIAQDIYYIVPSKCTECVGFHDHEACAAVCPVDCCIPDPANLETEGVLLAARPRTASRDDFPRRRAVALPQRRWRSRSACGKWRSGRSRTSTQQHPSPQRLSNRGGSPCSGRGNFSVERGVQSARHGKFPSSARTATSRGRFRIGCSRQASFSIARSARDRSCRRPRCTAR